MRTYPIQEGDTLVVSVNGCAWETVTLRARDFANPQAATAAELARVLGRVEGIDAHADESGDLVLATTAEGGHTSLRVDVERSTAAASLGLSAAGDGVHGTGLAAARLVGHNRERFRLPRGAEMGLVVDGKRRRVTFDSEITAGRATAAEIARAIGSRFAGIACPTPEGRVMLTSRTVGTGSSLEVERGREGKVDAAEILGFTGAAAVSRPYPVAPARLRCGGPPPALAQVENLTAGPIELHLPTGTVLLPARGSLAISPTDLVHPALRNLIGQNAVRVTAATGV